MQIENGLVSTDQGIRPTRAEGLAGLKTVFRPDGRITACNASQTSDGASAPVIADEQWANERGLKPRARILDAFTVGYDPILMIESPIPATQRILKRNKMSIDDIDLFEVNEAFAAIVLAWERTLKADRVIVHYGAVALTHPLGGSGARLITTLLHELERADKEVGVITNCYGGGFGAATLIQRIN